MSSAKKVCNEEARCHAVNESVLMWRERREGVGPMDEQLYLRAKMLSWAVKFMASRLRGV